MQASDKQCSMLQSIGSVFHQMVAKSSPLPKSQWREIQLTKYPINGSEDLLAQIRDVASLIMPLRQEGPRLPPNGGKIFLLPKSQWREIQSTKYPINGPEDLSAQIRDVASLIMPLRQEGAVARFTFDKWPTLATFSPE
ncbi:hypothetical protein CEXT_658571 [Caerostris extrusa]|uniref:Uncharacterized protein n=1 Tax=Caerostris extrusa TaxID=172846 RepID=A0AAV4RFI7_CAEEX|nr:hypothetical protein CEXT_658571 [Caerostris extrusa]